MILPILALLAVASAKIGILPANGDVQPPNSISSTLVKVGNQNLSIWCQNPTQLLFDPSSSLPVFPTSDLNAFDRPAMWAAGWQNFSCDSTPHLLEAAFTVQTIETLTSPSAFLLTPALNGTKRALIAGSTSNITPAFDICSMTTTFNNEYVISWNSSQVTGMSLCFILLNSLRSDRIPIRAELQCFHQHDFTHEWFDRWSLNSGLLFYKFR